MRKITIVLKLFGGILKRMGQLAKTEKLFHINLKKNIVQPIFTKL